MTMQQMWNSKFNSEDYLYGKKPNAFLKEQMKNLLKGASILFLGEGEGRNACYAATQGFDATALDASDIGIAKCHALAKELGVNLNTLHLDLETWHNSDCYDVIMCSFLHLSEPLRTQTFTRAIDALHEGGLFIAEFFSTKQLPLSSGGPKDPALLYDIDDITTLFSDLHVTPILLSECRDTLDEGRGHQGEAELIRVIVKKG